MRNVSKAQLLKLVVGFAIAAYFATKAFGKMDWAGAGRALARADYGLIALGLAALAGDYACRTARWWLMLRTMRPGLPLAACAGPFLGSIALNNVLPFRAGDVFRIFGFRRQLGIDPAEITGTMVVERLLDLLSLMTVFAVGLAGARAGAVSPGFVTGAVVGAVVGGVLLLALLAAPNRAVALARRVESRRAGTLPGRVAGAAAGFFLPIARLRSPGLIATLLGLSVAAWLLEGTLFLMTARALGLGGGGLGHFAMSTGTLATLIPSTPGYIGVFDYFTALGARAYGADEATSSLFALLVHALLWLPLTLGGFLALALSGGMAGLRTARRGSVLATDSE